jgi:hypothetical protein
VERRAELRARRSDQRTDFGGERPVVVEVDADLHAGARERWWLTTSMLLPSGSSTYAA